MFFQPKTELDWQFIAKCTAPDADPMRWDVESLDPERDVDEQARELCAGCPVMKECLRDALTGDNAYRGFPEEDDPSAPTTGVVRAGKVWGDRTEVKQVLRNRQAWIAEWNELVDAGMGHSEIRERMGMNPDAYTARLRRYGCTRQTKHEAVCKDLIRTWVNNRQRFTSFDLPYEAPQAEVQIALQWAVKSGLVKKLGTKPHPTGDGETMLYGQPDWPEPKPRLGVSQYLKRGDVKFGVNVYGNVSIYA